MRKKKRKKKNTSPPLPLPPNWMKQEKSFSLPLCTRSPLSSRKTNFHHSLNNWSVGRWALQFPGRALISASGALWVWAVTLITKISCIPLFLASFVSENIWASYSPRSWELRTQKLKSHLMSIESWKVLPFRPGVGQCKYRHACVAYCQRFLSC